MSLSWIEGIMCCSQDYHGEEEHIPPILLTSSSDCLNLFDDGKPAGESMLKEEKNRYGPEMMHLCYIPTPFEFYRSPSTTPGVCMWSVDGPPLRKCSILRDWATALRGRHAMGIVHGNLTPNSVGVAYGRGTLIDQELASGREPPDGDIYGARWAATELFRLDDDNPRPTEMSDVYSFACLALQMLTRSVPYCATKRSEQVVYLKFLGREPIDAKTPKLEDHYIAFLRRCWSPEPGNRPTMEDVIDFLSEEIRRLGG